MIQRAALILVLVTVAAATPAHATLTMHVDTTAKTVWFTGSDSGQMAGAFAANGVEWQSDFGAASGSYDLASGLDSAFDFTPSVSFLDNGLYAFDGGAVAVSLASGDMSGSLALAGNGTLISYGGFTPTHQAQVESTVGHSLSLLVGTGFSPIDVVPEPATGMLVGFGGLALVLGRRRAHR